MKILRVDELPLDAIAPLIAESESEDFRFLTRLRDDWLSGENRFDAPGEALFIARVGNRVVGVCGLNRDPYADSDRIGRVRRLYVAKDQRRAGVARALLARVIAAANDGFLTLHVRTSNPEAQQFYEACGFRPNAGSGHTHLLVL